MSKALKPRKNPRVSRKWHGLKCLVLAASVAALGLAASAGPAGASVTLGSALATAPNNSTTQCSHVGSTRGCLAIEDVLPGRTLVAPSTGVIDRWNVLLGPGTAEQFIRIRVVRRVSTNTFTMISSGGLEHVNAGAGSYSFATNLPISPGDQVALEADSGTQIDWRAPLAGANVFEYSPSPPDGQVTDPPVFTNADQEHTFNAELNPTNAFSLGTVSRNKKKGTATLNFTLPNPGDLSGSGNGAHVASAGGAVISKSVGAGPAQLLVKAKGKKKKALNSTGKVKLTIAVTYTPTGGNPSTQSIKVRLKKNR